MNELANTNTELRIKPSMPWTADDDRRLREMFWTHSRPDIARILGRSRGAVRGRCTTLGLRGRCRPWSKQDIDALRASYLERTGEAIRAKLVELGLLDGRTKASVRLKASRLGIAERRRPKLNSPKVRRKTESAAEVSVLASKRMSAYIAKYGHPRGMQGKKHTAEARSAFSEGVKQMWADPGSKFRSAAHRQLKSDVMVRHVAKHGLSVGGYSRGAGGRRPDLGNTYFRSRWEANYARYLNLLLSRGDIRSWQYEPKTFVFERIKRGTRTYTPDFLVVDRLGVSEWHEVKGWMDPKSKTRLARMAKYFPSEVVRVIGGKWFASAVRGGLAAFIPGWETAKSPRPGVRIEPAAAKGAA